MTTPGAVGGPLAGATVLDLSSVGPAARCTRLLADYGAAVVKVAPVPGRGAQPVVPPFFAYSAQRGMRRVLLDVRDPDGRACFLALAATADVVVESFRPGVVDRLGIGYAAVRAVNRRHRLLLDERIRPGRPACGLGRARPRLPGRRRVPGRHRAPSRRRPPRPRGDHRRRGGRGHAGGPGDHDRARGPVGLGRGCVPRRVGGRRGPVAHVPGRRRAPGHGVRTRPRPRRAHRSLRLLRHLPGRRRPVAGGGRHRGQVLRHAVPGARVRAMDRAPVRRRRPARHPPGPGLRLRPP